MLTPFSLMLLVPIFDMHHLFVNLNLLFSLMQQIHLVDGDSCCISNQQVKLLLVGYIQELNRKVTNNNIFVKIN